MTIDFGLLPGLETERLEIHRHPIDGLFQMCRINGKRPDRGHQGRMYRMAVLAGKGVAQRQPPHRKILDGVFA